MDYFLIILCSLKYKQLYVHIPRIETVIVNSLTGFLLHLRATTSQKNLLLLKVNMTVQLDCCMYTCLCRCVIYVSQVHSKLLSKHFFLLVNDSKFILNNGRSPLKHCG